MTTEDNIKAILSCFFSGFKEDIIETATNKIIDLLKLEYDRPAFINTKGEIVVICKTCPFRDTTSLTADKAEANKNKGR